MDTEKTRRELGTIVITLLKGVLYRDENLSRWQELLVLQSQVRDYVAVLGLELRLDENEGYAFLRFRAEEENSEDDPFPRLIARRQLPYPVSLLLALLRKRLAEFDAQESDERLVMTRHDVREMVSVFLPPGADEVKWAGKVDAALNKIVEMGFLRRLRGQEETFEVRRIIQAFIDAQWLSAFDERLEEYRKGLGEIREETDG